MDAIGHKRWIIADGYIPAWSHGPAPEMESHEAACMLNTGDAVAHVSLTVFYEDREPGGPYRITVPARRTRHVRLGDLQEPEAIPKGRGYSVLLESDVPIVVQQTRLDSRQSENALLSTLAFPVSSG